MEPEPLGAATHSRAPSPGIKTSGPALDPRAQLQESKDENLATSDPLPVVLHVDGNPLLKTSSDFKPPRPEISLNGIASPKTSLEVPVEPITRLDVLQSAVDVHPGTLTPPPSPQTLLVHDKDVRSKTYVPRNTGKDKLLFNVSGLCSTS